MSENTLLSVVLGLVLVGFVYKVWTSIATLRRSRNARKAYEQLSDDQKAKLERSLFKRDPALAALSKNVAPGRAILMAIAGILLAALLAYVRYKGFRR